MKAAKPTSRHLGFKSRHEDAPMADVAPTAESAEAIKYLSPDYCRRTRSQNDLSRRPERVTLRDHPETSNLRSSPASSFVQEVKSPIATRRVVDMGKSGKKPTSRSLRPTPTGQQKLSTFLHRPLSGPDVGKCPPVGAVYTISDTESETSTPEIPPLTTRAQEEPANAYLEKNLAVETDEARFKFSMTSSDDDNLFSHQRCLRPICPLCFCQEICSVWPHSPMKFELLMNALHQSNWCEEIVKKLAAFPVYGGIVASLAMRK